jgi:hypothetical protein
LTQQTVPRYRFLVSNAPQIALRPDVAAGQPFPNVATTLVLGGTFLAQ